MSPTNRATHLYKYNVVADLKTCPPQSHVCCHVEFVRSALKVVGSRPNTGEPKNWEAMELLSLGMEGVADPKIHATPPDGRPTS